MAEGLAARVAHAARDEDITLVAGGVAFFSLLSLFPALACVVAVYGLVASPGDVDHLIGNLGATVPDDVRRLLNDQLHQIVTTNKAGLGTGLVIGLVLALWSASAAMKHLSVALSRAFGRHDDRGYVTQRVRAIAITAAGVVFLIVVLVLLLGAASWAHSVNDTLGTVVSVVRWPLLAALMVLGLDVLYQVAPDRPGHEWRWISWGAVAATAGWVVASAGFSIYTSHFGSYNKTYGSLAAVVILMLWLYLSALCVLVGAEIDAALEEPEPSRSSGATGSSGAAAG